MSTEPTAAELVAGTASEPIWPRTGERSRGTSMRAFLRDIVLFSRFLAFVTGIVIAVASLLS